jgi:hypothetical protein
MQALADSKTAVKTELVTSTTPVAFKLAAAVANIDKLRDEASEYTVQYETGGRNALNKLMASVYKHYYSAVSSNKVEELATQLRAKLKKLDPKLEPTKQAHMSNMLVRYVFKDPDAKQVSVYARCLRVLAARSPAVLPKDFIEAVAAQKGGYGGFAELKGGKTTKPKLTPEVALSEVENLPTVETVSFSWAEGEEYRVLVAVRADSDGEAELKSIPVSDALRDQLLVGFLKEKDAVAKTPKVTKTADDQLAVIAAEREVVEAKFAVATAKKALEAAKAKKPKGDHKQLADAVEGAKAKLLIVNEQLKLARKK